MQFHTKFPACAPLEHDPKVPMRPEGAEDQTFLVLELIRFRL